jgi:hypothetical protein
MPKEKKKSVIREATVQITTPSQREIELIAASIGMRL